MPTTPEDGDRSVATAELGPLDINLLKLLQEDASLSTAEMAKNLNISQSPCWRRISQLAEAGIVSRQVHVLDRAALGLNMVVFTTVRLSSAREDVLQQFEEAVAKVPEVVECYTVAGNFDYMLKSVTRDIGQFEELVRQTLANLPGVCELNSNIAVTCIKDTTELPLDTQL